MQSRFIFYSYTSRRSLSRLSGSINTNSLREEEILRILKNVIEPVTGKSILSVVGLSVNGEEVKIELDKIVPGYSFTKEIETSCLDNIKHLDWVKKTSVQFSALPVGLGMMDTTTGRNLSKIRHIIGVSSCKGGVGKSTVAVNLSFSLLKKGLKVGLLDADIYGPSLPLLVEPESRKVLRSEKDHGHILPLQSKQMEGGNRLEIMSFGFVNPNSGAPGSGGKGSAVVRGPIASKIINQLVLCTTWGELDYLIIDMPPGTGDVQLTLSQAMRMSGLCVVTTPHPLSLTDAAKGIEMFDQLKVPTLAIVENMSYFICDANKKYYPFGIGGRESLLKHLARNAKDHLKDCPMLFLPLARNNNNNDNNYPNLPEYDEITSSLINELFKVEVASLSIPSISVDSVKKLIIMRYYTASSAEEFSCPMWELRTRDAKTGKPLKDLQLKIDYFKTKEIERIEYKGKYGVAFTWSDGHYADIFSFDVLKCICEDINTF